MEIERLAHRRAEVAGRIHAVLQASYREEGTLLGIEDFPPLRRTAEEIRTAEATFYGCAEGEELAAVAELEAQGSGGHIASLCVHPSRLRQGLGSRLVRFLLAEHQGRDLSVSTAPANAPALALYERHGFRRGTPWSRPDGIEMVTLRHGAPTENPETG